MPPRLKSTAVVAFMVLALYLLLEGKYGSTFYGNAGEHVVQANLGEGFQEQVVQEGAHTTTGSQKPSPTPVADEKPALQPTPSNPDSWKSPAEEQDDPIVDAKTGLHKGDNLHSTSTTLSKLYKPAYTKPLKVAGTTIASPAFTKAPLEGEKVVPGTVVADVDDGTILQEQFEKDSGDLDDDAGAGLIYGTTLQNLNGSGSHEGFKAAALTPTEFWSTYSDKRPYIYNPYHDYNSRSWKQNNRGTYKPCLSLKGEVSDLKVYSGHSQIFVEPLIGSFKLFETDFNLCFERETRLGPYGFSEGSTEEGGNPDGNDLKDLFDWDSVDWGLLQRQCYTKNANRYASAYQQQEIKDYGKDAAKPSKYKNSTSHIKRIDVAHDGEYSEEVGKKEKPVSNPPNLKGDVNEVDDENKKSSTTIEDEQLEAVKQSAEDMTEEKSRTAVLIRASVGHNFTANDKQNTRAMITELGLRSGGEYQIFLLVQVKDDTPIWKDPQAYQDVIEINIPQEFWNITILWNDAQMKQLYPLIPEKVNNVQQSHWLSVQKFAQDNPEFGFFWNWELDSRYTGHYYDFFEKVDTFSKAQPRKYLWERNERYFIPGFHGPWAKFMKDVETLSRSDTVWGPMPNVLSPTGPPRKTMQPSEDRYIWGTGEAADYISFAPIFNPVNSSWEGKNDIWGYEGEATPRRATIGTTSRCSRKLLNTMHSENLKGNHVGSEMTPQTVSLLNGLKAVYAPIPMFFDKAWSGKTLQKYFNPGPKGVSGSTQNTPFGSGHESRFQGSTWDSYADPPMRLYNNWLGYEDHEIGGPEWEKVNGRVCLPPMLLRPIKDVIYHGPGYSS